jgi:hypothetical protein
MVGTAAQLADGLFSDRELKNSAIWQQYGECLGRAASIMRLRISLRDSIEGALEFDSLHDSLAQATVADYEEAERQCLQAMQLAKEGASLRCNLPRQLARFLLDVTYQAAV